jgi:hypothetical protein
MGVAASKSVLTIKEPRLALDKEPGLFFLDNQEIHWEFPEKVFCVF